MQKYVAPADGARSGLGSAEIRIATLGSVRRPIASEAHRSERRGFWGAWGGVVVVGKYSTMHTEREDLGRILWNTEKLAKSVHEWTEAMHFVMRSFCCRLERTALIR